MAWQGKGIGHENRFLHGPESLIHPAPSVYCRKELDQVRTTLPRKVLEDAVRSGDETTNGERSQQHKQEQNRYREPQVMRQAMTEQYRQRYKSRKQYQDQA